MKMKCPIPIRGLCMALLLMAVRFEAHAAEPIVENDPRNAKWVNQPLAYRFQALDGRAVESDLYRGKVVLLDFWATWCGPCIRELPHVIDAFKKFNKAGFEIVGFSFDQNPNALGTMVRDLGMTWPQSFDKSGQPALAAQLGIETIPSMWLLDRSGRVQFTNARVDLEMKIQQLLDEPYEDGAPHPQDYYAATAGTDGAKKPKANPYAAWGRTTNQAISRPAGPSTGVKLKGILNSARLQQAMLEVDGTSITVENGQSRNVTLDGKTVTLKCEAIEEKKVTLVLGSGEAAQTLNLVLAD
jgi:thiol-disulfide isomerase/thioredoxin